MNHRDDSFFQVSVKGLHLDDKGRVLLIQEPRGIWEAPGGRIQNDENLLDALKRECYEETGIKCDVLDKRPLISYSAIDEDGKPRLMLFYKIKLESFDFVKSEECVDMKFFSKEELPNLSMGPTMRELEKHL